MDNNQPLNQNDNKQYLSMVNYLISQLNKAKVSPFPLKNQSTSLPIFLYEFFVFELYLPGELLKFIKQPILAFRLLDFPSLTLEGNLNIQKQSIIFNQGKSSYFEMDSLELKDNLLNQPMYIMFLDLNHGNIKVVGNCRLNISLFAYDSFLNYGKGQIPEPRRNILQLFDNTMEKIGEFEMSLIIRREYYKFDKNIEVKENNKTVIVKKAKKQRKILSKDKCENLMIKGKEKPKEQKQKEIIYDNNKISNSKYTKPQFVNNILIEKQDTAFNAHPINKEIIIKPKIEEEEKYPEDNKEKPKKKKSKVTKCNKKIGTELIPGVNVPIDKVDYYKKEEKKKKEKKNYNNYKNNVMLINSMYNKYQADSEYKYPVYELVPNNNNINYPQSNNINNQIINKNINNEMEKNQMNQINNNNNTYLKFLTDLKSKVNDYTNNLLNDKEILQKIKKERNLNQDNNLDEININENQSIEKSINTNNNNIINDSKIKKSENLESESKSEKNVDNENEDNQIQENNNINDKKENEKKEEEIVEEEKKEEKKESENIKSNEEEEEEEYNDFEASGKTNKSKNKQPKNEILDNKFNNYNAEFEENKEIDTNENKNNQNIYEELIDNNNNNNENNNNQSDDEIKEDNSLKEKNKENENQLNSGEINEEIDENIASIKKEIISSSEHKNPASSTEIIENLLK